SASRQRTGTGPGTLRLWDLETGKTRDIFTGAGAVNYPESVAFSPDGKSVAAAICAPGTVKVWDVSRGDLKATLEHEDGLNTVAFSPDGKMLASGGESRTVKLWDLATQKAKATFVGHGHFVYAVAFSPDRKTLASASADRTVKLWDVV